MANSVFTGVCTALVTPFLNDEINYPMMERLIDRQINAGVNAIVLSGTTGEAPTLSDREKAEMIKRAKAFTGNDCKIIAGTGTNSTPHAISLSRQAWEAGADALLVVAPYYNKGNASGLVRHFTAIAKGHENDAVGGERCIACYRLRMEETARMAAEGEYDYFTTTLSISPLKNASTLNRIGKELTAQYNVPYLYSDFKKKEGYKRSCQLTAE